MIFRGEPVDDAYFASGFMLHFGQSGESSSSVLTLAIRVGDEFGTVEMPVDADDDVDDEE